ncbi:MAG: hypothetical protein DHS20C11_11440 [Lysobacteraceae bacterium]|nr:MAG: hypothetical protein DHS20C11_11440 [Xanthomonadaceae bacterium]
MFTKASLVGALILLSLPAQAINIAEILFGRTVELCTASGSGYVATINSDGDTSNISAVGHVGQNTRNIENADPMMQSEIYSRYLIYPFGSPETSGTIRVLGETRFRPFWAKQHYPCPAPWLSACEIYGPHMAGWQRSPVGEYIYAPLELTPFVNWNAKKTLPPFLEWAYERNCDEGEEPNTNQGTCLLEFGGPLHPRREFVWSSSITWTYVAVDCPASPGAFCESSHIELIQHEQYEQAKPRPPIQTIDLSDGFRFDRIKVYHVEQRRLKMILNANGPDLVACVPTNDRSCSKCSPEDWAIHLGL